MPPLVLARRDCNFPFVACPRSSQGFTHLAHFFPRLLQNPDNPSSLPPSYSVSALLTSHTSSSGCCRVLLILSPTHAPSAPFCSTSALLTSHTSSSSCNRQAPPNPPSFSVPAVHLAHFFLWLLQNFDDPLNEGSSLIRVLSQL